jgi:hypothetical protein
MQNQSSAEARATYGEKEGALVVVGLNGTVGSIGLLGHDCG